MDCSYGIGVANRYALFLDSEVDPDALNDVEDQKKDQEKPSKKQDKRAKGEAKSKQNQQQVNSKKEPLQPSNTRKEDSTRETLNKPPRRQQQQQQQQQPQQQDGDNSRRQGNRSTFNSFDIENKRPDNRRNRRPFTPRDDTEGTPTQTTPQQVDFRNERDSRERSERGRGFRGRGRGRGGYFGGRDNRGKREFERHSGSDKSSSVKAQDKRDGAGSHNWGNVRDDVKEATNPELNTSAVSDDAEYANKTGDEATEPKDGLNEEEIAAKEAEAKQMSLDEYKAQVIMEREKLANKFNFRKAGEGEDQAQWKKTYVLKNKPDSKYDKAADDKFVREKISKPTVDIEIKFADTSRGGGRGAGSGPGRRGGGRGGGGRGRRGGGPGRGNNNMKNQSSFGGGAAPRMDDENDFPLLGK